MKIQTPWIVLPSIPYGTIPTGVETELINNLVEHTSTEFEVAALQEKVLQIYCLETVVFGAIGPLNLWVETSPYPSVFSPSFWAAIGGGGGAVPPVAPTVVAPAGTGTVQTILIPWTQHSRWARLVAQMPICATPLTAFWIVQAIVSGKGA